MALVYLLWSHDDQGPEDLVATLDVSKIPDLAERFNIDGWYTKVGKPNLVSDLRALLQEVSGTIGIYPLMSGWGGLHLQIAELV